MEEKIVVEQAKNGNKQAFDFLYEKYKGKIYNRIFQSIKNKEDTPDLVQDVFAKVYVNLDKYESNMSSFYTFVWENATQIIVDYEKKLKRRSLIFESNKSKFMDLQIADIADLSDSKDYELVLNKLLGKLRKNQRLAFTLACVKNRPYEQVASIMNKKEVTVRSIVCRARKKLQREIVKIYPELRDEKSKKYVAKIIVVALLSATAVTGLAYATYRVYNDIIVEKIFTLSEMRQELPESFSIISREEALKSINYYLAIFGEPEATTDDMRLVKDYLRSKICWMVTSQNRFIEIDSLNGELISYDNFGGNSNLIVEDLDVLYKKLNLPEDYELCEDTLIGQKQKIKYAKKYDNIYNNFQSVSFIVSNNAIEVINVNNYHYEDKDIVISKEKALEIAKENNIDVISIELDIENLANQEVDNSEIILEDINYQNVDEFEFKKLGLDIRKVWNIKIENSSNKVLVDAVTGKIIDNKEFSIEEKSS